MKSNKANSQLMATCLFTKAAGTVKYTNYSKYYKNTFKYKKKPLFKPFT